MSGLFVDRERRLQMNEIEPKKESPKGRKSMTQGAGNSREAKVLCSHCFKEVMREQAAFEDKGKSSSSAICALKP